jgi:S1-C subfamily serine protease
MRIFLLIIFAFSILLIGCDNSSYGLFGEQDYSQSEDKNDNTNHKVQIQQKEGGVKSEDIPELLLKTSVSISNFRDNRELNIGSGVFISNKLVVTNYHVVDNGNRIELTRNSDQKKFEGEIVKVDEFHDICIIKLKNNSSPDFLKLNTNYPKIGTEILVAGSPIGLNGTISKGIVSNLKKNNPHDNDLLQISAPISPGNSGGPVVNANGEILGISVSQFVGEGIQNINFAVPARYIDFLLKTIRP